MLRDTNPQSFDRKATYDPIIWLVWFSDDDFLGFDSKHSIGLICENKINFIHRKVEEKGKELELIPLRIYQLIACHNFRQYQTFHGLLNDNTE